MSLMMLMALMITTVAVAGASKRENNPGKQAEIAAAVKQRTLVQGHGQRGYELPVYVQLHQIRGHIDDNGRSQGIIQIQAVDDLKTGNLSHKAGNQHTDKEQRHDSALKTELKPFNDKRRNGSEHYIEENTYHQDDARVLKTDQKIFDYSGPLKIFQGEPAFGRKQ